MADVLIPLKIATQLKARELGVDTQGRCCLGLGNGRYLVLGEAQGASTGGTSPADALLAARRAAADLAVHVASYGASGDHGGYIRPSNYNADRAPLPTDNAAEGWGPGSWWSYGDDAWWYAGETGGVAVWVAAGGDALPAGGLWLVDDDGDLVPSGVLSGTTGLFDLDLADFDLQVNPDSLWPDTCWALDDDGDVVPKAVA